MANFQTKNLNLGKFWRVLQWRMLAYSIAIWPFLRSFGIFCDHLVYFMVIRYIFGYLVYFFLFGHVVAGKNLATLLHRRDILCSNKNSQRHSGWWKPASSVSRIQLAVKYLMSCGCAGYGLCLIYTLLKHICIKRYKVLITKS
jgi:hypothetical protein